MSFQKEDELTGSNIRKIRIIELRGSSLNSLFELAILKKHSGRPNTNMELEKRRMFF